MFNRPSTSTLCLANACWKNSPPWPNELCMGVLFRKTARNIFNSRSVKQLFTYATTSNLSASMTYLRLLLSNLQYLLMKKIYSSFRAYLQHDYGQIKCFKSTRETMTGCGEQYNRICLEPAANKRQRCRVTGNKACVSNNKKPPGCRVRKKKHMLVCMFPPEIQNVARNADGAVLLCPYSCS
jgi:hypothetical protein